MPTRQRITFLFTSMLLTACAGGSSSSPDAGSATCVALAQDVIPSLTAEVVAGLAVAPGDTLVFVTRVTSGAPTVLERVGRDGSGRAPIVTSTGSRVIIATQVVGGEVYYLETNEDTVPVAELFHVAVAGGGAPSRVGAATWRDGTLIVGADGTNLYLVEVVDQPLGQRFTRIPLAGGPVDVVATVPSVGSSLQHLLSGDDIYFFAGSPGSVYRLPRTGGPATPIVEQEKQVCYLPVGGFAATPTRIACGLYGVEVYAHDGSSPQTIVPSDPGSTANLVVGSDAENLYLWQQSYGTANVTLRKVATSGGAVTPVACDVGKIAWKVRSGFAIDQASYQFVAGSSEVFWVEERISSPSSPITRSLRRASK